MKKLLIIMYLNVVSCYLSTTAAHNRQVLFPHENRANLDSVKTKSQNVSIIFWNLENLYDPYDDTLKLDDEFTAAGARRWNWSKFSLKLNHTAKTLLAAGGWTPPAVIGLCEAENRYVLNKLVYATPLKRWQYKIVHYESPDLRGVDVALIYRPDIFRVLSDQRIRIQYPFDTLAQTREILCVKGTLYGRDTIILYVNHWPSRRGGYLGSQPRRNHVAAVLRSLVDSVFGIDSTANILIMGDFNDEPEDESLRQVLGARTIRHPVHDTALYNLMGIRNRTKKEGTLKYRDLWSTFDQFVVSGALMNGSSGVWAGPESVTIFNPSFLLEDDNTYFGKKLNRTYTGPRYHGGFSDHLPVRIELIQVLK